MLRIMIVAITAMMVLCSRPGYAQTPTASRTLAGVEDSDRSRPASQVSGAPGQKSVAPNNPWLVGAQAGYTLAGNGSLAENMLVSTRLIYELPLDTKISGGIRVPIMGNIASLAETAADEGARQDSLDRATEALLSTAEGLSIGLFPYGQFNQRNANLRGTYFFSAVAKVNTIIDGEGERHSLFQGRFGAGLEYALGKVEQGGRRPLTLSVSGTISVFSKSTYREIFGRDRSSLPSVEGTMILPVKDNVGALLEGVAAPGHVPTGRIGLILSVAK